MVAVNAEYSISVNEILREVTAQNPRIAGLINNLNEQAAERKVVSVLIGNSRTKKLDIQVSTNEICHNTTSGNTRKLPTSIQET